MDNFRSLVSIAYVVRFVSVFMKKIQYRHGCEKNFHNIHIFLKEFLIYYIQCDSKFMLQQFYYINIQNSE